MSEDTTSDYKNYSLLESLVALDVTTDCLPHHGVLAHEYDGSSSETHSDLLHLLGADIVCAHDEALGVVIQKLLKQIYQLNSYLK